MEEIISDWVVSFTSKIQEELNSNNVEPHIVGLLRYPLDKTGDKSDIYVKALSIAEQVGKDDDAWVELSELVKTHNQPLLLFIWTAASSHRGVEDKMLAINSLQGTQPIENRFMLCILLLMVGQADLAEETSKTMQKLDYDNILARTSEAIILLYRQNYADAHVAFRDVISMSVRANDHLSSGILLTGRGLANYFRGHIEEGLEDIMRCGKTGDALANVAAMSAANNNSETAQNYLNELRSNFPDHPLLLKLSSAKQCLNDFS